MGTIKVKKDGEWVKLPNYGVEEFPDAPSDGKTYGRKDKQWSEIVASNQYLDLTTLFPGESGTLSDENYQKIVDAYENQVSLAKVSDSNIPMVVTSQGKGVYHISLNMAVPTLDGVTMEAVTVIISADKEYTTTTNDTSLQNKGDGTKYLADDGLYKEIKTTGGALSQETQNNILDAINSIKFTDKNKTTVTAQEYNTIVSAFDGKITPNNDNMWNISYDKMIPSKFIATGTEAPIFGGYLVFDEFSTISLISYSTFYDYYYAIMGSAKVGETTLKIKGADGSYALTYKNNTGTPVKGSGVSNIETLTQSAYDSLPVKDSSTLYIIR